jgi:FdhD protein
MGVERQIIKVRGEEAAATQRAVVEELPVRLRINGRELLTLVASPHQLPFLLAGFLRLQGLITTAEDLLALGVCAEDGVADVRIRGEVPQGLRPVLTSGCGTGIVFHDLLPESAQRQITQERFTPLALVTLMQQMQQRAERYACHGGIHAAAVGDGTRLLLHAEDLGRHNTIDRIAGEALLTGVELRGCLLVTSGRVSAEMLLKAARLGIVVVASHTTPTSLAVAAAEAAGITLVGYLRGSSFEIYTSPERIALPPGGGTV